MDTIAVGVHRAGVDVIIADNHEILVLARWHWACGVFLRKWYCVPLLAVGEWLWHNVTFFGCRHAMLIYLEVSIEHGILVLL